MAVGWCQAGIPFCPKCLGRRKRHTSASAVFNKPVMVCRECDHLYNDLREWKGVSPNGALRVTEGIQVELCCLQCSASGMRPRQESPLFDKQTWFCPACWKISYEVVEVKIGTVG